MTATEKTKTEEQQPVVVAEEGSAGAGVEKMKKPQLWLALLLVLVVGGVLIWWQMSGSEKPAVQLGSDDEISIWANKTPSYRLVKEVDGMPIEPSEKVDQLTWPQVGIWQGLLPCVDIEGCTGQEVELRLYRENGAVTGDPYQLITKYHGVPGAEREVKGGIWTFLDGTEHDPEAAVYLLDYDRPGHLIFYQVFGEDLEKLNENQQRYESN